MKKIITQVVVLLLFSTGLLAQNINHLAYKIVNLKSSVRAVKPGIAKEYDVVINGDLIKTNNKEYNGGKLLSETNTIYDLSKNIRVALYEHNSYNIEIIDSIFKNKNELVSTGETKTIRGMKCEKYQVKNTIIAKVGNHLASYTFEIGTTKYSFWITKEIQLDKRINMIILKGLTKFIVAEFDGSLVQIDYDVTSPTSEVPSDIGIEVKEAINIDEALFVMPWKLGDKYKGVVPDPFTRDHNGMVVSSNADKERYKRHIKLLSEITGIDKPKYLTRSLTFLE